MSFRILQYFCSSIPSNFCSGNRCHPALLRCMSCCDHDDCCAPQADNRYQLILWVALAVNLTMFGVELVASIIAGSMVFVHKSAVGRGLAAIAVYQAMRCDTG